MEVNKTTIKMQGATFYF